MEWIRFSIGAIFIVLGAVVAILSVLGTWKFKFVLNRMHSAALNDTLGILFMMLGLIVLSGFNFTSLKLFLLICFYWIASPVASHLLAKFEIMTDKENVKKECEVPDDVDL